MECGDQPLGYRAACGPVWHDDIHDTSVFVDAALPLSVEVRLIVSPEIFGFQHNGMYVIFSEAPSAGVEC
jgi:hypothetical protein